VRLAVLFLSLALCVPVAAQDAPVKKKPVAKKPVAKKPVAAKKSKAHQKPTPEQIRRFKELEKKKKQ